MSSTNWQHYQPQPHSSSSSSIEPSASRSPTINCGFADLSLSPPYARLIRYLVLVPSMLREHAIHFFSLLGIPSLAHTCPIQLPPLHTPTLLTPNSHRDSLVHASPWPARQLHFRNSPSAPPSATDATDATVRVTEWPSDLALLDTVLPASWLAWLRNRPRPAPMSTFPPSSLMTDCWH
jgi:hypothetical protein